MKFEEMKEEELKETLELVKRVFDEFEAPDYTGEGVTNFYKFIAYDSILEQLKNNFKIFVASRRQNNRNGLYKRLFSYCNVICR